jgi:hypothetical protein
MRLRRVVTVIPVAVAALLLMTAAPAGATDPVGGVVTFSETGSPQAFVVPAGVMGVTVELAGAGGGAGYDVVGGALTGGASGGLSVAALATTPGSTVEVVVGGAGTDGSGETYGTGGYNGGGNGSFDSEIDAGGGGGGGATDVRTGACASGLDCTSADVAVVAGGGGGSAGGDGYAPPGGSGGGASGGTGGNPDETTGGSGGTSTGVGAAGSGSLGTGEPGSGAAGGAAGGDGGGGGGGYFGGGGGGESYAFNGSGGGGGSGYAGSGPGATVAGGGSAGSTDGTAGIFWVTGSSPSITSGGSETFTADVPSGAGEGTETFTVGATTLCSAVPVVDGTASCTTSALPAGSDDVTATLTAVYADSFTVPGSVTLDSDLVGTRGGGGARLDAQVDPWNGTTEIFGVTVSAVPVPESGAGVPGGVPPVAVILILLGAAGIVTTRRLSRAR